jgi:DnaJ-class molecular chaperone
MVRSAMPIHRTVTADMARRIFHLGSEEQASQTTLRGLYLKLALQWHPDKNQDPNAAQQFLHVKAAYDLLRKGGKDDDPDGEGGEYLT